MNIDKSKLNILWYENEEGEKHVPGPDDIPGDQPKGFIYQHGMFPTQLTHNILRLVVREEVDACSHPAENIVKTYGWIDGMEGRECKACHGTQVKKVADPWPEKWDAEGSRSLMVGTSGWSEDLVLAMANSGDFMLFESILVAANACERCMNSLAHQYGLKWGYEEYSQEWAESNTSCEFCDTRNEVVLKPFPGKIPERAPL